MEGEEAREEGEWKERRVHIKTRTHQQESGGKNCLYMKACEQQVLKKNGWLAGRWIQHRARSGSDKREGIDSQKPST